MNSRTALWTGRVLSGIAVLFLIFDGTIKLVPIQPVTDSLRELGYPASDSFARLSSAVRASTMRSNWESCNRACWLSSHFLVIACASCCTSMLSKGFFKITSRSEQSSFSSISSHE